MNLHFWIILFQSLDIIANISKSTIYIVINGLLQKFEIIKILSISLDNFIFNKFPELPIKFINVNCYKGVASSVKTLSIKKTWANVL